MKLQDDKVANIQRKSFYKKITSDLFILAENYFFIINEKAEVDTV